MLPVMIPLVKRLDLDMDVGLLSVYTRMEGCVTVAALAPVQPGKGRATVDGVALDAWETASVRGAHLVFLPLGRVAADYGRRYRVVLEGFETPNGRRFPRLAFWARTKARRQSDGSFVDHDSLALRAAREGMVLLRNENGALPLAAEETLNCLGAAQHWWRSATAGSSRINPRQRPGFHQAVAEHSRFRVNRELADFFRNGRNGVPGAELLERARALSDAALVFIGRQMGEMLDSRDIPGEYRLTGEELALLSAARAAFDRVIVILNTGGSVEMAWLREIPADAVLFTGYGGMQSAPALVELLDGRTNPSGHLTDTWPWRYADNPVSENFPVAPAEGPIPQEDAIGVRVYYGEDVYLGYRYFDSFGVPAAFPFGHGLSYTRFALKPLALARWGTNVRTWVEVRNTGAVPGKAVAQLYLSPPEGVLEKPDHALVGFEKTALLAPGESQVLTMEVDLWHGASFDEFAGAYVLEAGEYGFSVGESLAELIPCDSVRLEARLERRVKRLGAPQESFPRLSRRKREAQAAKSRVVPLGEQIAAAAPRTPFEPAPLPEYPGWNVRWRDVVADPRRLEPFVAGLSLFELCRLNVCAGMRPLPFQDGMAGHTPRLILRGLPSFCVSDASAGLNLRRPNAGFPASSVIAASFNRELAEAVGQAIAEECPTHGVDMVLAPGMNLHRGPLCGRNPEYFSEDPYLTGQLGGRYARGLERGGAGSCYKHLFCNNSELGRLGSHSVASERALRELYFRAFEIAFEVRQPSAVMTSYNALNGLYPAENAALLQGLLRGEWGFEGFVMSDWGSVRTVDAVQMAKAGNCWITPGGPKWVWKLWHAARKGELPRAVLEDNARRLLAFLLRRSMGEERY